MPWDEREGSLFVEDNEGRGVQLMPYRQPATEVDRWPQHARPSTTVHPGGPRKLGHVNCLSAALEEGSAFYTDVLGMRLTTGSMTEASGSTSTPTITSWRSSARATPTFTTSPSRPSTSGRCATCSTTSPVTDAGSAGAPTRHGIGGNIASYVRIVEEECFVELYCDMEQLQDDHVPRVYPDDRYSSNTWGPLPPRSYFRFDEAAVESERQSLEALGIPLAPLTPA